MTVQDLLSPVIRKLGYQQSDIDADAALAYDLIECVNDAVQAMLRVGDWAWLTGRETLITVADQETVNLPETFAALAPSDKPYFTGGVAGCFSAASGDELSALRMGGSTTGQPLKYQLVWSDAERLWQFSMWPTPNAAYSLVVPYVRRIPRVDDFGASPAIPDYLHPTLRLGAMAEAEEVFGREPQTREKFLQALMGDWARYGSPDRGQRSGVMRGFGDPLDELPMDLDAPLVVRVT